MIIQSHRKPDLLLPDMTFWTMTINQPATEIYKNYKVLCPTILYAEIYNHVSGANRRLEKPFEVLVIAPWQILVREELEGRSVTQNDNAIPINLKSEQNMSKEEMNVVESVKKMIMNLDKEDRFLSARYPISMGERNNALAGFAANAPYPALTWDQFIGRFKEVSKGTIFEVPAHINEDLTTNKNKTRTAIEKALSKYAKMYPINNFKKAFAFSRFMLEKDFAGVCDRVFIPMLENHIRLNRTYWDINRDKLTYSNISSVFPYTRYALYHYLAFRIYQNENTYKKKIGSRDFEYLYYLYFPNVLFISSDAQHKEYVTGTELFKSRHYGSFAYIPSDRDQAPEEHDKVMRYIKEGVLY